MEFRTAKPMILLASLLGLAACGGGSGGASPPPAASPPPPMPILFHCVKDNSCPEVMVVGDPFAETNAVPDAFRGYGDASLEYDATAGILWLAYSWLNVQISNPGPPVVFDLGVSTHLARSDDNGATFTFVRAVNDMAMEAHPDTGVMGWSVHEVPTVVKEPAGSWQLLWLKYFNPFGTVAGVDERQEFLYWRTFAATPDALGDVSDVWARSAATSPTWGAPYDFNTIPELADCILQTEPGLFAFNNETWLAAANRERLSLCRQYPGWTGCG